MSWVGFLRGKIQTQLVVVDFCRNQFVVCEQRFDLAEYGQIDADLLLFRIPIQFFGPNPAGQYFACRFGDGVQAERKAVAKQKAVIIHVFQNQIQTDFVFDADGVAAGLYDADVPFGLPANHFFDFIQ